MNWLGWEYAALAAAASCAIGVVLRRGPGAGRLARVGAPTAFEFALVASLYALWRLARLLPLTQSDGAIERARVIERFQADLFMPTELSLQRVVLEHDWLARLTNLYYATLHVPVTILFLVWMWIRHRDDYPRLRNALALVTAFCLFIRFVRVAPPRLMPDSRFVELSDLYGLDVYGPVGTGISDQFAAMPSMHVAWAAVVSFGVITLCTGWLRWIVGLHVVLTMLVVSATGHHWWLDGIVAIALLGVALAVDTALRRRRRGPSIDDVEHAPPRAESDSAAGSPVRARMVPTDHAR